MNIFACDYYPSKAAEALDDKRLVKMVLETAQILSTALHRLGCANHNIYEPSFINHPVNKWASKSRRNFEWAYNLGISLSTEYTFRYGRIHKSLEIINNCKLVFDTNCRLDEIGLTPFANCTPYSEMPVIQAYRKYLRHVKWKSPFTKWSKRNRPDWYDRV